MSYTNLSRNLELSVDEETADELQPMQPAADGRFKNTRFRTVLGLLCVVAVVAGGAEAIRRNTPTQEKSPAKSVGESLGLWVFSELTYCSDHDGMAHPMASAQPKCCAKECGKFCGAFDCENAPAGPAACCFSSPTPVPNCSATQKAPCMIPAAAKLGPVSSMFGAMSFTTAATPEAVKKTSAAALATYFGLALEQVSTKAEKSRRLHAVVPVPPTDAMWSVEFTLSVPATLLGNVQVKANAVFDDSTPLADAFEKTFQTSVKLVSFTTPKTTPAPTVPPQAAPPAIATIPATTVTTTPSP